MKHTAPWQIKSFMEKERKTFKMAYTPNDSEGFQYHVDLSHRMPEKDRMAFSLIPGINQVRMTPYHWCVQVGTLVPITPIRMLENIEAFLTTMGYNNVDPSIAEYLKIHGDPFGSDYDIDKDPMRSVVDSFLAKVHNDPFYDEGYSPERYEAALNSLEADLQKALKDESYMLAASLRDQILALKKKQS